MATAKKIDALSAGYAEQGTKTAGAQVHASGKKSSIAFYEVLTHLSRNRKNSHRHA